MEPTDADERMVIDAIHACELHREEPNGSRRFVCDATIEYMRRLPFKEIPDHRIFHLSNGSQDGFEDIERRLSGLPLYDIVIGRKMIEYTFAQNGWREWPEFVWGTLVLSGLTNLEMDSKWELRFDFITIPSIKEYTEKLMRVSRAAGFSARNQPDGGIWITVRKKVQEDYNAVFDCIVGEIAPVNKEMVVFVAERTALYDHVARRRIKMSDTRKEEPEATGNSTAFA